MSARYSMTMAIWRGHRFRSRPRHRSRPGGHRVAVAGRSSFSQTKFPKSSTKPSRHARDLGVTTILNAAPARPFRTSLPDLVDTLIVNAIEAEISAAATCPRWKRPHMQPRGLQRIQVCRCDRGGDGVASFNRFHRFQTVRHQGRRPRHSRGRRHVSGDARGANGGRRPF